MQITAACSSHYKAAVKWSLQVQRGKVIEIKETKDNRDHKSLHDFILKLYLYPVLHNF